MALRYTKTAARSTSTTPSLKLKDSEGNITKVISTLEEKERIFIDQAFPPQELEEFELPPLDLSLDPPTNIGGKEIYTAIFSQSIKKALGKDKLGFKAIRLLWEWDLKHLL